MYNILRSFIVVFLVIVLSAIFVPAVGASNFQWSVYQGCGPDEGQNDIYSLVANLYGAELVDASIGVIDQGGNVLVVSGLPGYMGEGISTLAEVYLDADSFVTFRVTVEGQSQDVTVLSGERNCVPGWQPSALEVEVSAPAGLCFYAHVVDANGVFLLTDSTYPLGIIWKATEGGYVELILDAYGNPDAGAYLLTATSC